MIDTVIDRDQRGRPTQSSSSLPWKSELNDGKRGLGYPIPLHLLPLLFFLYFPNFSVESNSYLSTSTIYQSIKMVKAGKFYNARMYAASRWKLDGRMRGCRWPMSEFEQVSRGIDQCYTWYLEGYLAILSASSNVSRH